MTDDTSDSGPTESTDVPTDDGEVDDDAVAETQTNSIDYKILGELDVPGSTGVVGRNTAGSGTSTGVEGETQSVADGARGVYGLASAETGKTYGVQGVTRGNGVQATGVLGETKDGSGEVFGVTGRTNSRNISAAGTLGEGFWKGVVGKASFANGTGVYGTVTPTTGGGFGVFGTVDQPDGTGVKGRSASRTGFAKGVHGTTFSVDGIGVWGESFNGSGANFGVYGSTDSPDGYGVYGTGDGTSGYAVFASGWLAGERDVAYSGNFGRHVATFENTSGDGTGDILGLKTQVSDPGTSMNFISFVDRDNQVGQVEGDGSGGVRFVGTNADVAEYFPKADPDRTVDDGQVVGLRDGEVVLTVEDVDAVLPVSAGSIVTGNKPVEESDRDEYAELAIVGQVPVRTSGPVESGDALVPSPDDDGTAVARSTTDGGEASVLGIALESHDPGGEDGDPTVLTLVSPPVGVGDATLHERVDRLATDRERHRNRVEELERENDRLRDRIDDLERKVDRLRDRIDDLERKVDRKDDRIDDLERGNRALRERLSAVEERLSAVEDAGGEAPTSADD